MTKENQKTFAKALCYGASWLGFGLGGMWLWLGWLALQPTALRNPVFNPVLLLDGTFVIIASIFVAKRSKTAVVFITGYAIIMELYLQIYQIKIGMGIKFKPYFIFELLALLAANFGVFWWHRLENKKTSRQIQKT